MPARLYPTKRQIPKSRFSTRDHVYTEPHEEVRDYLLCGECEGLFSTKGESEALLWLSSKAKVFLLADKIKATESLDNHPELAAYRAVDVGIDAEKFAYFALSVVWRGAVHQWALRDGHASTTLNLGAHEERLRLYLQGKARFPHDICAVIMMVSSDREGREVWGIPGQFEERGVQNFRLVTRGVTFRIALGNSIPDELRVASLGNGVLFYGDLSRRIRQDFAVILDPPLNLDGAKSDQS